MLTGDSIKTVEGLETHSELKDSKMLSRVEETRKVLKTCSVIVGKKYFALHTSPSINCKCKNTDNYSFFFKS